MHIVNVLIQTKEELEKVLRLYVHQMGEVLGKVSGCSCTQLEEYSSEAGVSFRKCCIRLSSKTGSQ